METSRGRCGADNAVGGCWSARRGRWRRAAVRILIAAAAAVATGVIAAPVASAADMVYWGNNNGTTISFANLDGGGGGTLSAPGTGPNEPQGVAIDPANGRIYWANTDSDTIAFANLNGSGGGKLNTSDATVNVPVGVAVDPANGKIYWANDVGSAAIAFANLDDTGGGGTLSTAGATVNAPWGVAVDPANGKIYWANNDNPPGNKISFANLDGSGGGDLNTSGAAVDNAEGVAIDPVNGRIYWANPSFGGSIAFANVNDTGGGGTLDTSGATIDTPNGVAVDPADGRIYWANQNGNTISFANLDDTGGGGALSTSPVTPNGPAFPVVLAQPSAAGLPVISGGSALGSLLSCSHGRWAPDLLAAFDFMAPKVFAYAWSENGVALSSRSSSIRARSSGSYACTVTATNHAGSTAQTSHSFTVTPSAAQIAAGLRSQLAPNGSAAKIAFLLKHGYVLNFRALSAGRVTIDWYYLRGGGHGSKPDALLVAAGKATIAKAGITRFTIRLTRPGRKLLERSALLRIAGRGSFVRTGQATITATKSFTLTS